MNTYAMIMGGIVRNIIVCDADFAATLVALGLCEACEPLGDAAGVGWRWNAKKKTYSAPV
jgi:hypothetical protein